MLIRQSMRGGVALGKTVRELYKEGQTDYSIEPIVLVDEDAHPIGRIKDGDSVIFCCRRGERATWPVDARGVSDHALRQLHRGRRASQ